MSAGSSAARLGECIGAERVARLLLALGGGTTFFDKDQIARTVGDGPRWRDVELSTKGVVEPIDDFALLTYEANATRGDGEPYHALVSSGYVKRAGAWKLAFHQQTPLAD